jgi:hypothetical protein
LCFSISSMNRFLSPSSMSRSVDSNSLPMLPAESRFFRGKADEHLAALIVFSQYARFHETHVPIALPAQRSHHQFSCFLIVFLHVHACGQHMRKDEA